MLQRAIATTVAIAFAAVILNSAPVAAEQCRDAKGKFIACPKPAASTKCRDKTTKKFAKCDAPNTEPVPEKKK